MTWQQNPNLPPLAAMRAALELQTRPGNLDDEIAAQVLLLIGLLSIQMPCLMRLSLLVDSTARYNLDTHPMAAHLLSELSETASHIMSTSDQLRTLTLSSYPSKWTSLNKFTLMRGIAAIEEIVDMCLDYHLID